jgi:hypothetical protein
MEEMLFVWAKEHPQYKYQQGLNEILAIIMVCLGSELAFESKLLSSAVKISEEDDEDSMDDLYSIAQNPNKVYQIIHDKAYYIADSYSLFERIMDLGLKELYYKDTGYSRKIE